MNQLTNHYEELRKEKNRSTVFLDVAQAFDKLWHKRRKNKLNLYLPKQFTEIMQSYISGKFFRMK